MSFMSARNKARLSQAEAAERLGITAASVCQWETGKTFPRASLLSQIASLYGCTIDELLAQSEDNKKEEAE